MINREDREQIASIWIIDVLESKPRTNGSERCNGAENDSERLAVWQSL